MLCAAIDTQVGVRLQAQAVPEEQESQCTCKRSGCLKLYCECFAAGVYCDERRCNCNACCNNQVRTRRRHQRLARPARRPRPVPSSPLFPLPFVFSYPRPVPSSPLFPPVPPCFPSHHPSHHSSHHPSLPTPPLRAHTPP
jgi:hypothetical protein